MAALPTKKLRLALAVGLLAMAAIGTGSTGITRIDSGTRNTSQLGLVGQEGSQLGKGPRTMLGSLLFPQPFFCAIPNPGEFFNRDPSLSAYGFGNDPLAVDILPGLKAGVSTQGI